MAYPARFFEDHPAALRGKFNAGAQILNQSFADSNVSMMRQQIGKLQKAGIVAVRDNELDQRCDFLADEATANARSPVIRTHIAQLVTELTNAGIYYMPSLYHWLYGLDRDATIQA